MKQRIIKNTKFTEDYQRQKLQVSIQKACLSVHEFVGSAEMTAERVCDHVEQWLEDKYEVTSNDLRRIAAQALTAYNPHAAYVYVTHNEID